jgi:hypothetical protein
MFAPWIASPCGVPSPNLVEPKTSSSTTMRGVAPPLSVSPTITRSTRRGRSPEGNNVSREMARVSIVGVVVPPTLPGPIGTGLGCSSAT